MKKKVLKIVISLVIVFGLLVSATVCYSAYANDSSAVAVQVVTEVATRPESTTVAETVSETTTVETTGQISTTKSSEYQTHTTVHSTTNATTRPVSSDIDFDGSISKSDIPNFSPWDKVGYISCSSVKLNHVPITYGWAQNICDSSQIVMADYRDEVFGQGENVILCGHNYKALKSLKNARVGDTITIETTYGANFRYKFAMGD